MADIKTTLTERGSRYGAFINHARITQHLKDVMHTAPNWYRRLDEHHREALEMIQHKIGRILNGDPDYDDSWIDIEGYAHLVVEIIYAARAKKENTEGVAQGLQTGQTTSGIGDAKINKEPDDVSYRIAK